MNTTMQTNNTLAGDTTMDEQIKSQEQITENSDTTNNEDEPPRRRVNSRRGRVAPGLSSSLTIKSTPGESRRSENAALKSSLTSSVRDRRAGLAATRGRLSVSFTDQKGLTGADVEEILKGFGSDEEEEGEQSLNSLTGGGGGMLGGAGMRGGFNRRAQLQAIQSQKSMAFNFDPADLEVDDD